MEVFSPRLTRRVVQSVPVHILSCLFKKGKPKRQNVYSDPLHSGVSVCVPAVFQTVFWSLRPAYWWLCYLLSDDGCLSAVSCQHMPLGQKKSVKTKMQLVKKRDMQRICTQPVFSLLWWEMCLLNADSSVRLISTAGRMSSCVILWCDGQDVCTIVFNLLSK